MKILKLDLRAFGPFVDVALDLSEGDEGLHLIYGPNEAGKSSALRALKQMLYGIPLRSSDHFLVGEYEKLRVGGRLRHTDGTELAFLRRKGNTKLLRTADDTEPIDDASLDKFLAGIDQGRFETIFSLDHEELVKGRKAVAGTAGLVGQLIFGAGTDLVRLSKLRKSIEDEHAEIFNARAAAKNPALNRALRELAEERKAIESASIRSADWHEKRSAIEDARTVRGRLDRELDELRRRKSKLERIGQGLPDVARRAELTATLATLADAPRLRDEFADDRRRAEDDLRGAERDRSSAEAEVAEIAEQLARLEAPGPILAESAAVEELQRRLGAHGKEERKVAELRISVATLEESARATLRDLGRGPDTAQAESLRLSLQARQQIRSLANANPGLVASASESARAIVSLEKRRDKADAGLDTLEAPRDAEALANAVQRARRQGDLGAQLDDARRELAKLERQAATALKSLRPWTGTLDDVGALDVPSEATILACQGDLDAASSSVNDHRRRTEDAAGRLDEIDRKLAILRNEREVPGEADLDAARARRTRTWRQVRARWLNEPSEPTEAEGALPDEALALAFERASSEADDLADRLRREADRVAEKARLVAERAQASPRLEALRAELAEAEARHGRELDRWASLWQPLGFAPPSPREMLAWRHHYDKLIQVLESSRDAESKVGGLDAKVAGIQAELSDLLRGLDEPEASSGESLDAKVDRAHQVVERIRSSARKRKSLEEERADAEARIAEARVQDEEARHRLEDWRIAWASAIAPLGLGADATIDVADAVLEKVTSLFDEIDRATVQSRRIEAFERDEARLADDVRALAARVAPELEATRWVRAAGLLNERLTAALEAKTRRDERESRRAKRQAEIRQAEARLVDARDRLDALAREAGCDSPVDLPRAERRADLRRAAESELEAIHERLRKLAGGSTLEAFIDETQGAESELDAEVARLEDEVRRKIEGLEQVNHKIGGIQTELDAMEETSRDARAHEAANRAQGLLALIESKAGQYVRLRLASAVLREAIERYRERSQGPVLRRAGEIFAGLTLGSFSGLRTLLNEKDEPVLVGARPDGATVAVEGMSDGTCDQLYLALKLASLEHHLDHNAPLPLVVDDILVNFDDERALAALLELATLSSRTQVLFFTHHRHLVDLAAANLPPDALFVHELRGVPVTP